MKRLLHLLVLIAMGLPLFAASPETINVTGVGKATSVSQKVDTDLTPSGDIIWHATSTAGCFSESSSDGAHLGSGGSKFNGTIALKKTTIPEGAKITKIELTGHCKSDGSNYKISATVGGVAFGEQQQTWKQGSSTSDQTMTFEGSANLKKDADGNYIVLEFATTANAYIYVKSIAVYYTESVGPAQLSAPVITLDNDAKQFTIASVDGGKVYYAVNSSSTATSADCTNEYTEAVPYLTEDGTYYVHAYAKATDSTVNSDSPVATQSYTVSGGTVIPDKTEVTLSWSATEATAILGVDFTPPTISYSPDNEGVAGAIVYSSSDESVAKFDANGQLQILAVGTTVITAKIPDDNTTFVSNTATYTLTVKAKPVVDPSAPGKWQLVKSDTEIEAYARYIIVGDKDAIATTNNANNRKTEAVTIDGETIASLSEKVMTFLLLKEGDAYIWQAENYLTSSGSVDTEAYLYSVTTDNNYLKCGKPQTANLNHRNTSISINTSHQATIKFVECNNRVIRHNPNSGSPIFGTYKKDTGTLVYLYKFVEDKKEPQAYEPQFPAELSMRVGDTYALTLGDVHPEVVFTVEGNAVEVADGVISAKSAGTATVKAEWSATDDWTAGSATIAVGVKEALKDPMVSFLHDEVVGMLNVGIVAQAAYHESDGEITYSSSNEDVVKVNRHTGMITPADVIAEGEAVITATIAGTDTYKAATATYKVRVENPAHVPEVDVAGPALFDFRKEGCYGFKTNETSTAEQVYELDMTDPVTTIQENNVTMTFDAASNSRYRSFQGSGTVNQLRIYAGAKFSFSVPEGFAIAKIVFNQIKSDGGCKVTEDVAEGAAAKGEIIDGGADPDDSETKSSREWVAKDGVSPATVNFIMSSDNGHVRLRTISVVIKKEDSTRKLPGLAFANRIYNTTEGVKTIVNPATKQTTEDVAISYAIDDLSNADYTIFVNSEGQLEVTVNTPGVYTLRAKSAPTPTLLTGVTILRLNVFPTLDLTASNLQDVGESYLLLAPEGGTVNFSEVPSTVNVHYTVDDAADEKVFDGNDIEAKADATYHYWMQYAETYNSEPQTVHVLLRPAVPEMTQAGKTYTFAVVNPTDALYYRLTEPTGGVNMAPTVDLDGWTLAENGTFVYTLPEGMADDQSVLVDVKAVKQSDRINAQIESAVDNYIIYGNGVTTSIGTIDAAAGQDAAPEFFTLQGVRVERPMAGQVYIIRRGAEVTKVLVR